MKEVWVQFLGGEDLLEEGTATHSSILAWRIPWTEEPGGLESIGHTESGTIGTGTTRAPTVTPASTRVRNKPLLV